MATQVVSVSSTSPTQYLSVVHELDGPSAAFVEPLEWGRAGARPILRLVELTDSAAVFEWVNWHSCEASSFSVTVYRDRGTRLVSVTPATADADAVHSGLAAGDPNEAEAEDIESPDVPRNLTASFDTAWAGGDLLIEGTDQFGNEIEETIPAGDNETIVGTKIFATVTAITKTVLEESDTTAVTVGFGDLIGLPVAITDDVAVVFADDVPETPTAVDTDVHAFTPDTAPDGAVVFKILVNV